MKKEKVIVVPLRPHKDTKEVTYLMVPKSLNQSGLLHPTFPKGDVLQGETTENAAKRILLQETGCSSSWVNFLYSFFREPDASNERASVYMALILEESDSAHAITELSGDDLLKKIRENDVIDESTLAAFSAILLQGSEAKKYLVPDVS